MKQAALAPGTDPSETSDSILAGELQKLRIQREKFHEENRKYIDEHPELHSLVDQFVTACIHSKPTDIVKFGHFFFSDMRNSRGVGPCPIVIAGPSGVGKGTLITKLMEKFPKLFGFCTSHTTRQPRPGEENGVHYHFTTKPQMEEMIDKGEFVEYAKVHTNLYGTAFKSVEKVRKDGKICVLDIDIQGVASVKKSTLDCKYLFISPPSLEDLAKRLKGRGTESADKIQIRLENAKGEMEFGMQEGNFDAIVTNKDLKVCFNQIVSILQGWFPDLDLYTDEQ